MRNIILNKLTILLVFYIIHKTVGESRDPERLLCFRTRDASGCFLAKVSDMRGRDEYVRTSENEMCIGLMVRVMGYCNLCYRHVTAGDPNPLCQNDQCVCEKSDKGRDRVRVASSTLYRKHLSCKVDYWTNKQRRSNWLKRVPMTHCNNLPLNKWRPIAQKCENLQQVS